MAGRKRKQMELLSKTAKASVGKNKDRGTFQSCPDMNRIIPLAGGKWAYIQDPRADKLHHLEVGSESWCLLIQELLETEHGPRIHKELQVLGWDN